MPMQSRGVIDNSSISRNLDSWSELRTLRAALLVIAIETALSAVFIFYFCRSFKISEWLVAIHLPLSFGLFAASMLIPGLLLYIASVREFKLSRIMLALVPGLTFAATGILYATGFSVYFWS